ncbi:MAG: DUF3408 domain-containing protein [Dysgonomonas mossii]|uniref:DUF3408 domain-containing protein n=1 Tax=Dysgonomonas mossii TaxID=163665 RepID=UPI003995B658
MGKKIITQDESDEDLILRSLMKGKKPDIEQPVPSEEKQPTEEKDAINSPVSKDSSKKKRQDKQAQEYLELFIKESTEISRIGKTINIRSEFHERILLIIQMIGGNKVSIFSYIDNILKTHLEDYEEIIDELLENSLKQKLPSKKK